MPNSIAAAPVTTPKELLNLTKAWWLGFTTIMSFIGSQHYQDFWTETFSLFAMGFFFASAVAAVDGDDESFVVNHARFIFMAKYCAIIAFAFAVITILRHLH